MATRRRLIKQGLGFALVPYLLKRRTAKRKKTIEWSGHRWQVRDSGLSDPGPNRFNHKLVRVDASGRLHLRIAKVGRTWECSEIHLERALGFGTYMFTVLSDVRAPRFDPQATLGMFTYDWNGVHAGAGEVDIEFARWGVAKDPTELEYSVQPIGVDPAVRNKRMAVGPPPYICSFEWTPRMITFAVVDGGGATHKFTDAVSLPHAPSETTWPFINLWLNRGRPPLGERTVTAVLESFSFTKHQPTEGNSKC